jgi:hypothetical protein
MRRLLKAIDAPRATIDECISERFRRNGVA